MSKAPFILTILCIPVGKGRPRVTRNGTFTPQKTRNYERLIKDAFYLERLRRGNDSHPVFEGRVALHLGFGFPSPKKPKYNYPPSPDLDNLIKAVMDALNKLAWKDDSQVVFITTCKAYTTDPVVRICIMEIPDDATISITGQSLPSL